MKVTILYDGDCPFCSRYVHYLRLKDVVSSLSLVDLRVDRAAYDRLAAEGYDLDSGMVAEIGPRTYHGADAMHALSMLATPSGAVNSAMASLFRSTVLSALFYPILRAGRSLVLDVLGRHRLAGENGGLNAKFRLFSLLFGFFSIFHAIAYTFHYNRFPPGFDIVALLLVGGALVVWSHSLRLFLGLIAVSLVSAWLQAPVASNHTLLRNYVALGFLVVYCIHLLRGAGWQRTFADFSVVAGGGLVVMYFFGIFHKINSGFLDPEVSCAVALWRLMPAPLSHLEGPFIEYGAIYSTFLVEGLILIGLFVRPLRHVAIAAGVLFHWLLALSNFSMYLPFTTLSMSLHVLFLSADASKNVMESPLMRAFTERCRNPVWVLIGLAYLVLMTLLVIHDRHSDATLLASLFILPICYAILRYGASGVHSTSSPAQVASRGGRAIASVLGGAFFLICLLPYSGLKSAQAMNMFANLRVEGGVSNHLIFRTPPQIFNHMSDVVVVRDVQDSPKLNWLARTEQGIVYYDLLARLRANPDARVTFERDGLTFADQSASTLAEEIDGKLHSPIFDKVMNFRTVTLETPPRCH